MPFATDTITTNDGAPYVEAQCQAKNGVPGEIRTHGPQIRNLVLYPTELRGHTLTLPSARVEFKRDNGVESGRQRDT